MDAKLRATDRAVEVVKMGLSQSKDGIVLRLRLHPHDDTSSLITDPVGSRYYAVLVPASDAETEDMPPVQDDGVRAVAIAGELCRLDEFYKFILLKYPIFTPHDQPTSQEEFCRSFILEHCGISSRADLKAGGRPLVMFNKIVEEFREATNAR